MRNTPSIGHVAWVLAAASAIFIYAGSSLLAAERPERKAEWEKTLKAALKKAGK